jgi:hypothetical protein
MKFRNYLILLILGIALSMQAQEYKSAIGLRLGVPISISYKRFISEKAALEFVFGYRNTTYWNYLNLGAYYQHHFPIKSVDGLAWYLGGGANVFIWDYDNDFYPNNNYSKVNFGISGCIGLDYKFADIPLNLSVDWIPTIFINSDIYSGFVGGVGALAVRYVIN